MNNQVDIFNSVTTCVYRDETYHVRDNGAVYRCCKSNTRKRPLDENWTFGTPNIHKGYLNFSFQTVHRIVATAFHGQPPSAQHVVDHIDTNRKNNRPENLRWVTKLENILINPITCSRITKAYGSIDNFLADPTKPLEGKLDQNFDWMRTVTKEESDNALDNLMNWAKEGKLSTGNALGDWIHYKIHGNDYPLEEINMVIASLTPHAFQINWKTPSEFPHCPTTINENALMEYQQKLIPGEVFAMNNLYQSIVEDVAINETTQELIVLTRSDGMKPFALAKVYLDKENFIHESMGSFFTLIGAQKQFTLAQGLKWEGEDSIDDYS